MIKECISAFLRARGCTLITSVVVLFVLAGCAEPSTMAEPGVVVAGDSETDGDEAPGQGFVVWESNRTGAWRLWFRDLDGSPPRQLSPEEGGRQHCCAHVEPGGERIAYLSLPRGQATYPEGGASGRLYLIGRDGSGDRLVAENARTYYEHRAVVWRSAGELIAIDGDGRTRLIDVATGVTQMLTDDAVDRHGWLINSRLTHATRGLPSFSSYDAAGRRIREARTLGGCQPYFSYDGRWGFWTAGAGGPIRALDLATRQSVEILKKSDPRLPGDRGYLYFPMLSHDATLFAWGASPDEHDHAKSDYDIFVAPTDPETLEILGRPWRVTRDPGSDRFPDVYAVPGARRHFGEAPRQANVAVPTRGASEPASWPIDPRGLIFLWQTDDGFNDVEDPATGEPRACLLEPRGRAWVDRNFAMVLSGGFFVADDPSVLGVLRGAQRTNELSIEVTVTPHRLASSDMARIMTFSGGMGSRNFTLGQVDDRLSFRLRTASTGRNADRPQLDLGQVPIGRPTHLVVSYSAGHFVAYLDGRQVLDTDVVQDGFFHWQARPLIFGNEWQAQRPWHGGIEGVAIYDRVVGPEEVQESFRRAAELRAERPVIPQVRLRATLRRRSPTPSLEEISPYRQALSVYEYEVEEVLEGEVNGPILRVVHRVLADGEALPVSRRTVSQTYEMTVEPFFDHPELESLFLSDALPKRPEVPLVFSAEVE